MGAKKPEPYVVNVLFDGQEKSDFFKPLIGAQIGLLQMLLFRTSRLVFSHLLIKGKFRSYIHILVLSVSVFFLYALASQIFWVPNPTAMTYAYMFLLLLIFPFLLYFMDVYQAMQLRLAMNRAVLEKSYPKLKPKLKKNEERQPSHGKFEWTSSNLAILNAVIRSKKKDLSYSDFGRVAGVDRSTAVSAINKMVRAGVIHNEDSSYALANLEFEVWIRTKRKLQHCSISREEVKRLKYLFEVMCFAAF